MTTEPVGGDWRSTGMAVPVVGATLGFIAFAYLVIRWLRSGV